MNQEKRWPVGVSVIMPVYNSKEFVAESIESILGQSYSNWELIIVDDGSTDGSGAIIDGYSKADQRIKVVRNSQPSGFGGEAAANQAIKLARGKYIAKMDSDDVSLTERLTKEVEFLDENPDVFMVGGWARVIDEKGRIRGERRVPVASQDIWEEFYLRSCVVHPSIMFRNERGGRDFYDLRFRHFNDYHTFFELMKQGKRVANIPDFLIHYRVHGKNTVYTNLKEKFEENYKIKQSFLDEKYRPKMVYRLIVEIQRLIIWLLPENWLIFLINNLSLWK